MDAQAVLLLKSDESGISQAVQIARMSDFIVLALGEVTNEPEDPRAGPTFHCLRSDKAGQEVIKQGNRWQLF